jgi:PBSX family phage terminase large subunit
MQRRHKYEPSSVWSENYVLPYDKDLDYIYNSLNDNVVYNILIGSTRSAKTTVNTTAFCMNLELSPDQLFFTIATSETLAKSILWEGDGFGIKHYPDWQERVEVLPSGKTVKMPQRIFEGKYKQRDALILYPLPHENKPVKYIVAYGGAKETDYKSFRGSSVGMVIATEANLLHPNTIQEYMARIGASKRKKVFEDGNPGNPRQWYKTNRLDYLMEQRKHELNYGHRTLKDNPILTDDMIESLSASYPEGSVFYRNLILGEWVGAEGLIYTLDRSKNLLETFNPIDYYSYVVVADPGVSHSATVFKLIAITRDRKYIDTLKEYWHKNDKKQGMSIKMPIDYAIDYMAFIRECIDIMGKPPIQVMSDLDLTFIREFERLKYQYGLGAINLNSQFKKEEIKDRIKNGVNLLWTGRKRIYKECVKTWESYESAQYDPKEELKGNYIRYDDPQSGTMIDCIDTDEYAETYYKYELGTYRKV